MRCKTTAKNIVSAIPYPFDGCVIEIGCGTGSLTEFLIERDDLQQVVGFEIEKDTCEFLQEKFSHVEKLTVIEKDFLEITNFSERPHFLEKQTTPDTKYLETSNTKSVLKNIKKISSSTIILIGNLPYNRAAQIIFHCLENLYSDIDRMIFTVQWEVALRFASTVGEPHYSKASVCAQYFCEEIDLIGSKLSPEIFWPAPKVYSQTIVFKPKKVLPKVEYGIFKEIVRGGFGWRRKQIGKALFCACKTSGLEKLRVDTLLRFFPEIEKKRGEEVDYELYEKMSRKYEQISKDLMIN